MIILIILIGLLLTRSSHRGCSSSSLRRSRRHGPKSKDEQRTLLFPPLPSTKMAPRLSHLSHPSALLPRELHLCLRGSPSPSPSSLAPQPTRLGLGLGPTRIRPGSPRTAWTSAIASVLPSSAATFVGAANGGGAAVNVLAGKTKVPIQDPIKLIGLELVRLLSLSVLLSIRRRLSYSLTEHRVSSERT